MSETGGSTFRTASVAAPASTEVSSAPADATQTADTHESSLFATYELDQKRPFMADYFEVGNVWDKEETLGRDLKEIEGYIRTQVEAEKVDNSIKAVKEYVKELERKAGLSRYESTSQRIQKILAYIDFRKVVES